MPTNYEWLLHMDGEERQAWFDAEHVEPTNVNDGGTNGISTDAPLADRDPVEIMRNCGGMEHGMGLLRKVLGIECVSGWQMRCLKTLADMVERDYVHREAYEDLRDEFTWTNSFLHRMGKKCGTKDVPSLVAYVDKLEAETIKYDKALDAVTAERDELKAMNDRLQVALDAVEGCDERCKKLEAERDVWKAKAEAKSAKRAAAAERLKDARYHTLADYVRAMLGWGHEPHFEDCRDALIDLLTNNQMDAQRDSNGTCPDANGTCTDDAHSKAQSKTEPKLSELFGILSDANDDSAPENDVSAKDMDANDGFMDLDSCTHGMRTFASETDSREKLEADVYRAADEIEKFTYGEKFINTNKILRWLDRQAAITERECCEDCDIKRANERQARKIHDVCEGHAELQEQVDRLTAERDALADDLLTCNREREHLRKSLGIALDHAHDMLALVDLDGNVVDRGLA